MLKKSKLIIGATFIAQAFSCLVLGLIYMKSNKSLSKTCFALGCVGGLAGGALLFDEYRKQLKLRRERIERMRALRREKSLENDDNEL